MMLAYVFWHWKQPQISALEYETRQQGFHRALNAAKPAGFHESLSVALPQTPWLADGAEAVEVYEDWYLVDDFTALGTLNEGAISASRKMPHDAAAIVAAGGAGGVYGLKIGKMVRQPRYAYWFSKPNGMSYDELYAQAAPLMDEGQDALWMRQMVLGPAPEFCLQTSAPASFSSAITTRMLPLRVVWPQSPDATD